MTVVLLDRDGVINRNREDYVKTVDEFEFLPGALEGLAKLKRAGITTVVLSNQAGVGRGLIDPAELERINRTMLQAVAKHGGEISGLYYCIHRKEDGCNCRKPAIGLIQQAGVEMGFDPSDCFFIGDAESDIEAGCNAGCRTILVLTGKSSIGDIRNWRHKPEYTADDLPSAVDWVLAELEDTG